MAVHRWVLEQWAAALFRSLHGTTEITEDDLLDAIATVDGNVRTPEPSAGGAARILTFRRPEGSEP